MAVVEAPPAFSDSPRITRCSLAVRFNETDLMGIVHHANYLHYFEVGRVAWLTERGLSYAKWLEEGIHLPVVNVNITYRRAARFGDELMLETFLSELTGVTLRFAYRLFENNTPGAALLCEGSTLLACVGDTLTPRRFPEHVAEILKADIKGELVRTEG